MGDRATIRIVQPNSPTAIHLYTHWSGHRITETLVSALTIAQREGRLNDDAYCTRIIFDTLTGLEGGSTGYGIIIGDESMPSDLQHNSPCIEWEPTGEPVVYYTSSYDASPITQAMPVSEWLAMMPELEDPSGFDLTYI